MRSDISGPTDSGGARNNSAQSELSGLSAFSKMSTASSYHNSVLNCNSGIKMSNKFGFKKNPY